MDEFLKRGVPRLYRNRPMADLLAASPGVLKGVTANRVKLLAARHNVRTLSDLLDRWELDADLRLRLDPAIVAALWCYVFHPRYDPGPPCRWERLFASAPLDHYVNHPSGRFRTAFGPVFYRGRLDGAARVLVVGQDPSTDEILAQRNLVGDAGQKLQRLLNKLGLTRSYVMLNSFVFGIKGQFDAEMEDIAQESPILAYRHHLFDRVAATNALQAIFAFGKAARTCLDLWPGHVAFQIIEFTHPSAPDNLTLPNWNAHLAAAQALVTADPGAQVDLTPYGVAFTPADSVAIPRADLPFGIPPWHGTHGTRSHRNGDTEIVWEAV